MNNKKMILIYGFDENEKQYVRELLRKLGDIKIKLVEETMANMKIKDIIDGLMIKVYDKELPNQQVILFNNLNDKELEGIVSKIQSSEFISPILAVVTKISKEWTFKKLVQHLIEEKQWFKKQKK
ncbi:DUF3783 domain-containing protein [Haloimpatiens myeolchijeotgali]|uniref:DUF3783 domain-containing protein n=1 Tax=Haloimpatiens sp. FM7330 TaxID=3298610 RepID=UPI00384C55E9